MIEVTRAALLAYHGLLGSVGEIHLQDVYLTSVPSEHLAALASCVTGDVHIKNVKGCGLVSILNNLRCEHLIIRSQSLSSDDTDALIRATETESRVKHVDLECLTLDCLKLLPEIAWSANLANQGRLSCVREIHLRDIDLSSVPGDHLASLAFCVAKVAHIGIVKVCDLVGFLNSLKCTNIVIHAKETSSSYVEDLRTWASKRENRKRNMDGPISLTADQMKCFKQERNKKIIERIEEIHTGSFTITVRK